MHAVFYMNFIPMGVHGCPQKSIKKKKGKQNRKKKRESRQVAFFLLYGG
jgi:hypothetical protein